jgi:hypothetical protein
MTSSISGFIFNVRIWDHLRILKFPPLPCKIRVNYLQHEGIYSKNLLLYLNVYYVNPASYRKRMNKAHNFWLFSRVFFRYTVKNKGYMKAMLEIHFFPHSHYEIIHSSE